MIVGLGNDIVEVARIEKMLSRHSQRFLDRVFTPLEQNYCLTKKEPSIHLAARFAAKEAVVKALGTGFSQGIGWLDIEIVNDSKGKPLVVLSPELEQRFQHLDFQLSISHCHSYATAVALCSQTKRKWALWLWLNERFVRLYKTVSSAMGCKKGPE